MGTAQVLIKQAVDNSVKCASDYGGPEENYLIGSLRSRIRTLCNELDQFKAVKVRIAWALVEGLLNDHANNLTDLEQDAVGSLLDIIKRLAGGSAAIQSALQEYKHDPEILI